MTTVEHLLRFADEATAIANPALAAYGALDAQAVPPAWQWDASRVLPFRVVTGQTQVGTDPDTGLPIMANTYMAGFFLRITLNAVDPALDAHPACIIYEGGERFQQRAIRVLTRKGFTAAQIAALRMEPEWAGMKSPNE